MPRCSSTSRRGWNATWWDGGSGFLSRGWRRDAQSGNRWESPWLVAKREWRQQGKTASLVLPFMTSLRYLSGFSRIPTSQGNPSCIILLHSFLAWFFFASPLSSWACTVPEWSVSISILASDPLLTALLSVSIKVWVNYYEKSGWEVRLPSLFLLFKIIYFWLLH